MWAGPAFYSVYICFSSHFFHILSLACLLCKAIIGRVECGLSLQFFCNYLIDICCRYLIGVRIKAFNNYLGSVRHRGHKFGSYFFPHFVSSRARSRRSKSLRRRQQLQVNKCTSGKHRPKRSGTRSCPCTKSVRIVDLKPEDVIILTYMFSWITILEYMLI
jgi:hypothetical protein